MTYPVIPTPSGLQFLRSKATVRRSDIPILPDTPPLTPIRDDYFPPPPVNLADDSFALPDVPTKPLIPKPAITKPTIEPKPVLHSFSQTLTKIIDSKKNKIQIIPKKTASEDTDDINLSE